MCDGAKTRALEGHIEALRAAINEMTPIMDWASVKASEGEVNKLIMRYIEKTAASVREALDGVPLPARRKV